jgi:hypothetical protein
MRMTAIPHSVTTGLRRVRLTRARQVFAVLAVLAVTAVVAAAGTAAAAQPGAPVVVATSLDQVLDNIRNWLIGILAALATACLTVAGVRYVIASGDPAEIEKAKAALRAACLGYVLAMLAPVIVAVLKSIVGA